jgi:hypothetical protein
VKNRCWLFHDWDKWFRDPVAQNWDVRVCARCNRRQARLII